MSQPAYVEGVWLASRLGVSQYRFRQLVNRGDFPAADLIMGKTRLWRLLPLAERFPGLADGLSDRLRRELNEELRRESSLMVAAGRPMPSSLSTTDL